jgi:type IV pilus assembly protein PilP
MEKPSPPVAETFTYDPTGKRDPFEPDLGKEQEVRALPQELQRPEASSRALESLEAFDLTQLRVAAIIWDTKIPRAMVIDPSGGTHYIKAKSRIGRKNGFVAAIREGEIVVIEYNQENGQYTKVFKVLELR